MTKFNLELCQALLNQTRSIDHTAELMSENANKTKGFQYWQKQIVMHINIGDLVI